MAKAKPKLKNEARFNLRLPASLIAEIHSRADEDSASARPLRATLSRQGYAPSIDGSRKTPPKWALADTIRTGRDPRWSTAKRADH